MKERLKTLIERARKLNIPPLTIRNLVILVASGTVFVLLSGLGLAQYATSHYNCLSCHSTGETRDMSVPSKVHPGFGKVSCVECHSQVHTPGFALASMKEHLPYLSRADRLNDNCIRCHPDVADQKELDYKKNEKNIIMNHELHVKFEEMRCPDCHYTIAHDRDAEPTNRPKMAACMGSGCHVRTKETCDTCHPEDSIEPPKHVHLVRTECGGCHKDYKETHIADEHLPPGRFCKECHTNQEEHGEVIEEEGCNGDACHDF